MVDPLYLVYAAPLAALWTGWWLHARRRTARAQAILADNVAAGLDQPASLHPVIDPSRCLGCGSCARACPEKTVIGIIDGKAALVEPTLCVGHGACQTACPTKAITLVFGTATRGVDIPVLSPDFETSVPGIYIAGELGGMGLIRNAIEQGRQAIGCIADRVRRGPPVADCHDVVIIGCGPAGIAASLGAIERKLDFVTVDQSSLGGTVAHFPRGKLVMTGPADLPLVGRVQFSEVSKEHLLSFWEDVLRRTGLAPRFGEQVLAIRPCGDAFEVETTRERLRARTVLLAIGRRGTPRALEVPGEDRPKVVYRLIDPAQYAGRRVLVVGGGDSALEAAAELAEQPGTTVTLSYRGAAFGRARARNRERVESAVQAGRIDLRLESRVVEIAADSVRLEHSGRRDDLANDDVVICAGGILPTGFLRQIGIEVETRFGNA
ncbi:MAG: NAD(P)-binding domain-containing protein [Sphingomonadales bacterium]|nr:NAD(P)-binding domain-containing protein [Sphingomonadales bacterium]